MLYDVLILYVMLSVMQPVCMEITSPLCMYQTASPSCLHCFPPTESDPIKFPAMQSASQCGGILCSEWASFGKGEDSIDVEIRQLSDDHLICVVMMGTGRGFFVPENVDDCPKKNSSFEVNEIEVFKVNF